MNKDELVRKLAEEFGISTIDIYQLVNNVVDTMSRGLARGKNINISEFGKFKVLTRKNEGGESRKTITFSPVKKLAFDINSRYNDLSPTPLKNAAGEESKIIFKQDRAFENIKTGQMDNKDKKDKYDENLIRDDFSDDSSSNTVQSFINSKLEDFGSNENNPGDSMKEFELPHTLIELHKDITEEGEEKISNSESPDLENLETTEIENITSAYEEITNNANDELISDIESLVEERKKILEQITPDVEITENESSSNDTSGYSAEKRENFPEFQSFEEEKNAELSKIIAERNKIIDDINSTIINTEDIPVIIEEPSQVNAFKETPPVEWEKPVIEEQPEKPEPVIEETTLREDRSFEKKLEYDETNLIHENFDPIITSEDDLSKEDLSGIDYTKNDILVPEDVESLKEKSSDIHQSVETQKSIINDPKSFEDVFESKDDQSIKSEVQPPPVSKEIPPPVKPPVYNEKPPVSYSQKMRDREKMYNEKDAKTRKKGLWITMITLGFLILIIYLAYNSSFFTPAPNDKVTDQQNNTQQNTPEEKNTQSTPPPTTDNNSSDNNAKEENTQQTHKKEQTTTSSTQTPQTEELLTVAGFTNVAFFKTSDGIYVQTGSYKSKSVADKKASEISTGNYKSSVMEADLGEKGKFYRVRIGKFTSLDEAKEFAGKLK